MKPGVRLGAGLSALGLAAAFLTGCSGKDPDEGLCDDATKALESVWLKNVHEPVDYDAAKLSKLDKDPNNQELENDMRSAVEQATKPEVTEKADKFGEKCPAFDTSGS